MPSIIMFANCYAKVKANRGRQTQVCITLLKMLKYKITSTLPSSFYCRNIDLPPHSHSFDCQNTGCNSDALYKHKQLGPDLAELFLLPNAMYNIDAQYIHIYLGPDLTELQVQTPGVQDGHTPSPAVATATGTPARSGLSRRPCMRSTQQ